MQRSALAYCVTVFGEARALSAAASSSRTETASIFPSLPGTGLRVKESSFWTVPLLPGPQFHRGPAGNCEEAQYEAIAKSQEALKERIDKTWAFVTPWRSTGKSLTHHNTNPPATQIIQEQQAASDAERRVENLNVKLEDKWAYDTSDDAHVISLYAKVNFIVRSTPKNYFVVAWLSEFSVVVIGTATILVNDVTFHLSDVW
ncbi:hypothetical protein K470DRAFT_269434 [Piedraia hortae CBS 480.64]|uniref:Uncharacterized protein n=1 Tax=Piedraia hortae CBS 480.64 TaxID=1314780 RepID=A0A6A7C4M0_9PEZI|nr:hypothetical protein K470DRAFT_269434 [Piedraia hortae CBS 480.64]